MTTILTYVSALCKVPGTLHKVAFGVMNVRERTGQKTIKVVCPEKTVSGELLRQSDQMNFTTQNCSCWQLGVEDLRSKLNRTRSEIFQLALRKKTKTKRPSF